MKKLLLIFAFILLGFRSSDVILINKGIYISHYSEHYESPVQVGYWLYKPHHAVDRAGAFYREPGIHTANNDDFKNNDYDKGHMAPAEDFSDSDDHMHKTFSYSNCTLQHSNLNRGVWKELETEERALAQSDSLLITCDIIFSKSSKKLPSGAYIPDKFRKTIVFLTTKKKVVYEFPNNVCAGVYSQYQLK